MKRILIIPFCLFLLNSLGQTPDYFANNPTWYCAEDNSMQWFPPFTPYTEHYVYYINNDTLLLDNTYHHLYRRGYRHYDGSQTLMDELFDEPTNHFLRQEGRAIRFINSLNNTDDLLVDYETAVGDTVQGDIYSDFSTDTVQKVDSILINTEYRRVLYLDTINGPMVTEGIGHQLWINQNIGELVLFLGEGIGFNYYLNCYGQNNIPLWDFQGNGGNCALDIGVSETVESEALFFVTPNPATDYIRITSSSANLNSIFIRDLNGRLLIESKETLMDISRIPTGLYILEVIDDADQRSIRKLIKQ